VHVTSCRCCCCSFLSTATLPMCPCLWKCLCNIVHCCCCCCKTRTTKPRRTTAPPKTSLSPISLPHELYGRIIQFVTSQSDLLILCHVSRGFYDESVRVLYYDVTLPNDPQILQDWFDRIAVTPRLSRLVTCLSFHVDRSKIEVDGKDLDAVLRSISDGLSCLGYLKECAFIRLYTT
jgi:hypothetical protein